MKERHRDIQGKLENPTGERKKIWKNEYFSLFYLWTEIPQSHFPLWNFIPKKSLTKSIFNGFLLWINHFTMQPFPLLWAWKLQEKGEQSPQIQEFLLKMKILWNNSQTFKSMELQLEFQGFMPRFYPEGEVEISIFWGFSGKRKSWIPRKTQINPKKWE